MTALSEWFREKKTRMPAFYEFLQNKMPGRKPSLITVQRVIYQNASDNFEILPLAFEFLKDEIRREKEFDQKVREELKKSNQSNQQ